MRATPEQLCDALGACTELNAVYRRLLKMALEELRLIDEQIGELDKEMASLLSKHQDAVERLAEVPGLGVDKAKAHCKNDSATPKPRLSDRITEPSAQPTGAVIFDSAFTIHWPAFTFKSSGFVDGIGHRRERNSPS